MTTTYVTSILKNIHVVGDTENVFTPSVEFNAEKGVCEISGQSYLKKTYEFYEPLYEWLETYIAEINKPLTFNMKITYFNTSSSKCILEILRILGKHHSKGGKVTLNWYIDQKDEDMQEEIEYFAIAANLPIHTIMMCEDVENK